MNTVLALVLTLMLAFTFTAFAEEETWHLGILVHSLDNEFWAQ